MSGQPTHIEIGVPDTARAQRFYGELLGWSFDGTEKGAMVETGGIPAGLHRDERGPELLVFYSVDDIDEAARRIVELGGEVDEAGEEGSPAAGSTRAATTRASPSASTSHRLNKPPPPPLRHKPPSPQLRFRGWRQRAISAPLAENQIVMLANRCFRRHCSLAFGASGEVACRLLG